MGGDLGAEMVLGGAQVAAVRHPGIRFVLVGDQNVLTPILEKMPSLKDISEIVHAENAVSMDDKPSQAVRRGRKTSMWMAIDAVRQGKADVAVSAGNTGALMAMAKIQLKTMEGIGRPAIASPWPTEKGESVVLDLGANVECDSQNLFEFAIMGAAFARILLGQKRPSVGLLNIGEEELKGNETIKDAAVLLKQATDLELDYIGFIEGDGISQGHADVVVADGFTGNIALKTAEGTAKLITGYLKEAFSSSLMAKMGYLLASFAMNTLKSKLDPREHNGGVFLGLNGLVVKSHGGTDDIGFASAIDVAVDVASAKLTERIKIDLETSGVGENGADSASAASETGVQQEAAR